MLARLRAQLTYANVMATTALFVALGGVGWAAATIDSGDVVDNSLKSVDLKDGKGVKGADVVPDSLTGASIDESTLGQVPGAANADTLDNKDSADFAVAGSEAWQAAALNDGSGIGQDPGTFCFWTNFGSPHNDAAYFRDPAGVVHLRGLVLANDGVSTSCTDLAADSRVILTLPVGYRTNTRWVLPTVSNNSPGRLNVTPEGWVQLEQGYPTFANARQWVSLDGITFRCAPSGSDGCP